MDDVAYGDSKVSNADPETIPVADSKKVATGHSTELMIETDDVGPVDILPHDSNPEVVKVAPVKVGLLILAFEFHAVCVRVEMGLPASVVLSTFPRPTAALETPDTVPVKLGLASGAFDAKLLATVLAKLLSSFSAVDSSLSVFSVTGAASIRSVNLASTSAAEYVSVFA